MGDLVVERWWGDLRLNAWVAPYGAEIAFGGEPALALARADGPELLLTIPPGLEARVWLGGAWVSVPSLHRLGRLEPHPTVAGASVVRVPRPCAGVSTGIELVAGERSLRIWVDEAPAVAFPVWDRRGLALRAGLALALGLSVAGSAAALQTLPPSPATLAADHVAPIERMPRVLMAALESAPDDAETKHDVPLRAPGGGGARSASARSGAPSAPDDASVGGEQPAPPAAATPELQPQPPSSQTAESDRAASDDAGTDTHRGPLHEGAAAGLGTPAPPLRPSVRLLPRPASRGCLRTWSGQCRDPIAPAARRARIVRVLRRHRREVETCHARRLASDPDAYGRATLRWQIDPAGRVHRVRVDAASVPPGLVSCLRGTVEGMSFSPDVAPAEVRWPLALDAPR